MLAILLSMFLGTAAQADTGVVKFYNATKGFGFVVPDDGGPDLFFYYDDFLDWREAEKTTDRSCLSYEVGVWRSTGKPAAKNIRKISCRSRQ